MAHQKTTFGLTDLTKTLSAFVSILALASCHGSLNSEGSDRPLAKVEYKDTATVEPSPSQDPNSGSQITYEANIAKEQAVADGCLKAWRKAVQEKDEEGAMKMLEELDKKYSGISSVQFMMGQVKEHFGKNKEAVEHFKRAHNTNEFSSMQTYKLAESMRKSGDAKGAIPHYKRLVGNLEKATGQYGMEHMNQLLCSVRLGLAHAYKDTGDNVAALDEVKKAAASDPASAEAKSLLKELENTGK